jgi:uncharacterized peroxidase-related enzyme
MSRLDPLPPTTTPELKSHFDFFLGTLGFTPNSVLTMQRRPKLVKAFAQLNAAVMDPDGEVDLGFRRLIGHMASKVSGCLYCQAHTVLGAKNFNVSDEKLSQLWTFETSQYFSEAERVALRFSMQAAAQPNEVSNESFAHLKQYWTESQIVEILAVVAMFGFLNRWNDSMATPLEAPALALAQTYLSPQTIAKEGFVAGKHIGADQALTRYVFVYGTLREGDDNDITALKPAPQFVGRGSVVGTMFHLGAYPGVVLGGAGQVQGEVYAISPALETKLDAIESEYPAQTDEYFKRAIQVNVNGHNINCIVYEINPIYVKDRGVIESGDWVKDR